MIETLFLDLETYYDKEYSLRKMTPAEYVLDPRFEAIGCAVKHGVNGKGYWVKGADLPKFFGSIKPQTTSVVTYNALFDMCVIAWRYGFVPRLMVDALGVARACLGHRLRSLSLASVAAFLDLGAKGATVHNVIGMRAADIEAAGLMSSYVDYSLNDNELCAGVYDKLVRGGQFPINELAVMDMVLRCAVQPQFRVDVPLMTEHLNKVLQQKNELLTQAMLLGADGRSSLMSNDQFAALLRSHGVEPPMKISGRTGQATYAFAKSDPEFVALEEHPNTAVQVLVGARLGTKGTLEETRTQRILNIANLTWPGKGEFPAGQCALMPMPLRFSAAHTHRLGGEWKINVQNLPVRKNNTIRRGFVAPPGHVVIAADEAQIEARMVAALCGQQDLVDQFAAGVDVYADFASHVFGKPVSKKDNPVERFIGKTGVLGLGFQCGPGKFQWMVEVQSKDQTGTAIILPDDEAERVVYAYRGRYPAIKSAWWELNSTGIQALSTGAGYAFGPCTFERGAILLPNGLRLFYHDLQNIDGEWKFTYAGKPEKIYGGKLLENIVQALARIVVMEAGVRIQRRLSALNLRLALQVHDELVYVVPLEHEEAVRLIVAEEMARPVQWLPNLPLAVELSQRGTKSYGDAK